MKQIDSGLGLSDRLLSGVSKLSSAVGSTLGPRGRNVLIRSLGKPPFITKDGVTVASHFSLEDPIENAAAEIVKQVSKRTNMEAGDGTTTSTVLAYALLKNSFNTMRENPNLSPTQLARGLESVSTYILNYAHQHARQIEDLEDIRRIATISSNNDESIGDLITLAVDKVGYEGSITIEESRTSETVLDLSEGFRLESGYVSSSFITDERKRVLFYESPMFLVTDARIETIDEVLPSLEIAARESRPFVIVCEEIEGQALAALIMNSTRGTMKVSAIKAPGYGQERRDILSDLAASTGAKFFQRANGDKINRVSLSDFGAAKSIRCSNTDTVIIGGEGKTEEVISRINTLTERIKSAPNSEANDLTKRLVQLQSSVATIKVGGSSEIEVTEKKHRIEDALEAVRSALEEGVVEGGGSTFKLCSALLEDTKADDLGLDEEQAFAIPILAKSLLYPSLVMAENAGLSKQERNKILVSEGGYDFLTMKNCNLFEAGIIDPFKVTRVSLKNAISVTKTLLTTNVSIVEVEPT